jgi:DNA polymerase-3 subunit alpha
MDSQTTTETSTATEFVHLHVHTQYSLLQGAIHVESLIEKAVELKMKSVAITDLHNLFGAVDFYLEAKKAGVKPIIGCEIFYSPLGRNAAVGATTAGSGPNVTQGARAHHLVLLCKNLQGYQNLCRMVSQSYQDAPQGVKPQAGVPRAHITRELLDQYGGDLIVLSGCLRGEIAYKILSGDEEGALESVLWFKQRFGADFYLEIQSNGMPEQDQVNEVLAKFGEKYGIDCVATADCHYLTPENAEAHEILQCIEHGKNLDFERPKSLVPSEYYLKTAEEMAERFTHFPKAISNTVKIAESCDVEFKFKDEHGRPIYHLPKFRPEGVKRDDPFDLIAYFRSQSEEGLKARFQEPGFQFKTTAPGWPALEPEYHTRLASELDMIGKTGFAGYFLIVADFINWAKREGIPVGPGRGSGAGSLVAYALGITNIDPIEFNLLFERFINPERISMPDFDVDFCQDRRGEVIEYVSKKYGSENVCQIITFGKLQARAVIKDVGRVLGLSFADSDAITKLLPDELDITLTRAIDAEPRLREKMASDSKVAKVMEYALALEGLYRNAGIHAAGVIITENPVVSYCPLYVGKDGDVVTQFDKDFCEAIGLVKFDFLGLKTLTVIDNAIKLVHKVAIAQVEKGIQAEPMPGEHAIAEAQNPAETFSLDRMNYHEPQCFALISSGDTDGVFQVESSGMKDLCMRIQPGSLEDLTAINALYRPGPLGSGMVDDFIDRKHGRKEIQYDVEILAPILKDTYGVILYQEQVMQIARELAGYSLGQADLLRRAMGKKKADEMAKHREIFVKGAVGKGIPEKKAEGIFDLMAKFAEYGFNKSHSAAYGVLTYQTAYLKARFPAEFMAALMTTEMDNTEKITKYISDARSHGLPVLPPDVNFSEKRFSVEWITPDSPHYPPARRAAGAKGAIKAVRFGLEAIKGVGGIAVDSIIEARTNGPFLNVLDFARRVPTRKVNKKVLESLTLAGGFDSIAEVNRASLFASLETILDHAGDEQQERELGQSSLFDAFSADDIKMVTPSTHLFKQEADWPSARKLALERQVVGFYISGHPMDTWQKIGEEWLGWSTERIKNFAAERAAKRAEAPAVPPGGGDWGGGFTPGRFRAPKTEIRLIGLLGDHKEVMTKKGDRMAFAQVEDLKGKLEVVFFAAAYATLQETVKKALAEAEPLVITADLELTDEAPKLQIKALELADEAHKGRVQQVVLKLSPSEISGDQLRELKKNLLQHRGRCSVRIDFTDSTFKTRLELPKTVGVTPSPQMVASINQIFGSDVVSLQ